MPKAAAAGGDLDITFDGDGIRTVGFGGGDDLLEAMAIQADGKIVTAGTASIGTANVYALNRYNPDGSPDVSFGNGGLVLADPSNGIGTLAGARALAIAPDGKIVAGGTAVIGNSTDFAVLRFNADGSPDTTFDGDGVVVTTSSIQISDIVTALVVQPDGKIVAAGRYTDFNVNGSRFGLARYNVDGSLDNSFGAGGRVATIVATTGANLATGIRLQSDGKIVVSGQCNSDFCVVRYNTDGSVDTTFSGDGIQINDFSGVVEDLDCVAIQPDGKIVGAGRTQGSVASTGGTVIRYNTDGSLDTTFDSDGWVSTSLMFRAREIAIQPDGKIVIGGRDAANDLVAIRLNTNGSLDTTLNGTGKASAGIATNSVEDGTTMLLQPDGKIVVAGYTTTSTSNRDFALVRFSSAGVLDATFDGDGKRTDNIGNALASIKSTAIQPDGKIVAAGFSEVNGNDDFTLLRFNTDGSLDSAFGSGGIVKTTFTSSDETVASVLIQPDGKIIAVGTASSSTVAIARYNPNGTLDTSFDSDGLVTTAGPVPAFYQAEGAILQPDGKIVVVGCTGFSGDDPRRFRIFRYNTNGSLDPTFGTGGVSGTNFGDPLEQAYDVAIQTDGKLVVAGGSGTVVTTGLPTRSEFAVARFNTDGSLDTTFDSDGMAEVSLGGSNLKAVAADVEIQPDGKIVLAGTSTSLGTSDFAIARLNSNGSPDTGFDTDGQTTVDFAAGVDAANAIAIQADGRLELIGTATLGTGADFAIAMLSPSGVLDSSFGTGGKKTINVGLNDVGESVSKDPQGRYVIGGQANSTIAILRTLADVTTAAEVSVSGRVITGEGRGLTGARVTITDPKGISRSFITTRKRSLHV